MKSSRAKLVGLLKLGAKAIKYGTRLFKTTKTTSTTSKLGAKLPNWVQTQRNNPANLPGAKTDYVGGTGQLVTQTKSGSVIPVSKGSQVDVTKTGIYSKKDWDILMGNK